MRPKYPALFLVPAALQLAIVLLATVPLISATPSPLNPSPRGFLTREPAIQQREELPPGWAEKSCYTDSPELRTLTSKSFTDATGLTVESCVNYCHDNFDAFAGLENGRDCYCGNSTTVGATATSHRNCDSPCVGNSSEICGGSESLSLYTNGVTHNEPIFVQTLDKWSFVGCYNDSNNVRSLPVQTSVIGGQYNNSVESCVEACGAGGYSLAGMEFAQECWCGNSLGLNSAPIDSSKCPLACPGDGFEYCGGANSMVLYNITGTGTSE